MPPKRSSNYAGGSIVGTRNDFCSLAKGAAIFFGLLATAAATTTIDAMQVGVDPSLSDAPQVCTYDYTIAQRVGSSKYDGLPLKIIGQPGNGAVDFIVGNTWTEEEGTVDAIYVISNDPDATDGSKFCYADSDVRGRKSVDSSLQAYCGRAGVAMVRLYVADSNFSRAAGDDAEIPDGCPGEINPAVGAVEYVAALQCEARCDENTLPDLDPFAIDVDDDGCSGPGGEVHSLSCPKIGDGPLVVEDWCDNDVAEIGATAGQDTLCTLVEMSVAKAEDGGGETVYSNLKPVGRSYNGNAWEIAPGDFAAYKFEGNRVALPKPSEGRSYVLKSYDYGHELTEDDLAARFLERATFGPTKTDVANFTSPEAWLEEQFATPVTSHRQFYRERATNWYSYTGQGYGLLHAGPCKSGGRYRGFALLPNDYESILEIQKSSLDSGKLILSIGGEIRTVVDGPLQYGTNQAIEGTVDVGEAGIIRQYVITGHRPTEGVGGKIRLKGYGIAKTKDIYFDGVFGNPPVHFDADHAAQLTSPIVELSGDSYVDVMTQYFFRDGETEVLQLVSNVSSTTCNEINNGELQGFTWPPKTTLAKTTDGKYWIYSPTFSLLDNDLDAPLIDGGNSAVELTEDPAPEFIDVNKGTSPLMAKCSNVPRTFLNEDSCRLADVDDACSYDQYADISNKTKGKVLLCGSPNEVANTHDVNSGSLKKGGFDLTVPLNSTSTVSDMQEQRRSIWAAIALNAKDQLAQKMAYALSQILVVSDGQGCKDCTENYLSFYDIFVRNYDGNYFDILKEVTLHPLMSYMLTYINGQSTAYAYNRNDIIQQADENYAREIMQLFTIGIALQNDDGTLIHDENGDEIATYTNFEISEYAKVYVGFREQHVRGNIEGRSNQVDPLRFDSLVKDFFPKFGLFSKYVGDGYALCSDLPNQHFLKKGATYRLLGAKANPDAAIETKWIGDAPIKRLSLDFESSALASLLQGGENKVILTEDIDCFGVECDLQEPRTIEVADGLWYEYIRSPCVNQVFFNDGKSIYSIHNDKAVRQIQCGNPAILDGSTFCTNTTNNKNFGRREELFGGERVTFDVAVERCNAVDGLELRGKLPKFRNSCDKEDEGACDRLNHFYWLTAPCTVSVKINSQGSIAIVHEHNVEGKTAADTYRHVANDTMSFFRADWLSTDIESFLSDFDAKCEAYGCYIIEDGNCQCGVTVEDIIAFEDDTKLISVDNLLSVATIGAFVPDGTSFIPTGVDGISRTSGEFSSETIFEVIDSIGRIQHRKNLLSFAKLGDGTLSVRNPVSFWALSGYTNRDAEYELNAALEHYFYHPNVPSFLALRLAQRFGISNPSPRYITAIATAFKTGKYKGFGSNAYGCLKATLAAIILDREAQDHILDADPIQGQLQGPFMRLIKSMRALDYETDPDNPIPRFKKDILEKIGEEPHKLPTVFSFFKPEYIAPGRARAANMLAPEAQVLNAPTSISTANGLISLIKYGSSNCYDNLFGTRKDDGKISFDVCVIGNNTSNFGNNKYSPSNYGLDASSADEVVDDLAMILTSGRLSPENKQVIKGAFMQTIADGKSEFEAMINAQQLIALSPEFHSTSLIRKTSKLREIAEVPDPSGVPYKAIIHLMLAGGMDSFSVLVPKTCSGTNPEGQKVHDQYTEQRGPNLVIDESDLIISPKTDQPCEQFVINKDLPYVKELYDNGDLLFFANTGVVNKNGMTRANWDRVTQTRLFAHNTMQEETKKIDPYSTLPGSGILGRLKDLMATKFNSVVNAIGINHNSIALSGDPAKAVPTTIVGGNGPVPFGNRPSKKETSELYFDLEGYVAELNSDQDAFSGIYGDTWSETLLNGIVESDRISEYIEKDTVKLDDAIWELEPEEDKAYKEFQTVSRMIQTRTDRHVDRDLFTLEYGGWDHHDETKTSLATKLPVVNRNLKRLCEQLKEDGLWDKVTIVVASEFGRTITPNSNNGSDHGWGGNYFIIGGGIAGGRVLGKYPDDFTETSRLNASRNLRVRFIPTTGWDSIWNGIVEWFGDGFGDDDVVTDDDLDYVLPNRANSIRPVLGEGEENEFQLYKMTDLYG